MNQKVMQFNQQSNAIQAKRHLLKCQSLIAQLRDEYDQINWPGNVGDVEIHDHIRNSIQFVSHSIQNFIEILK